MKISTFRGYYPDLVKISTLLGYYPHFVDISALCGYDMHFGEISTFRGYDPHFVDTIDIGQNTSYLARNVRHVVYSFVLVVDIVFGHIMSYLACNVHHISHFTHLVKVTGTHGQPRRFYQLTFG